MKKENWLRNDIQFARLIAELECVGGFTPLTVKLLCQEMSLEPANIYELIDRAIYTWDFIKENTPNNIKESYVKI